MSAQSCFRRCSWAGLSALLLLPLLLLLADIRVAQAQSAPPNIPQGGSTSFSPTNGTGFPGATWTWEIVTPGGGQTITNAAPNGWTVAYSSQFTVGVPVGAAIGTGYSIYYNTGGGGPVGSFNVVAAAGPPAAPTGLAATGGNQFVNLTWAVVSGASSYSVYRGTAAGGESATALFSGLTSPSATDSTVSNGTTYYYVVKAVNSSGPSAASNEAHFLPSLVVPAAPTGLSAAAGNAQITLTWAAVSGATGYQIYRGTSAGGESATAIASATSASYPNTGLTNGTVYYYTVKATNGAGSSVSSNEAHATPIAPPAAPTNLTATPGNAQVSLTWTASAGAASYNVKRSTTSGGPYTTVASPTTPGDVDTGLTNGTTYYYVVSAVNTIAESAPSSQVSAMPLAPPVPPSSLTALPGSAQVTLTWTASPTAASYNVYRGTGAAPTLYKSGVTATSYLDTGLTNGTAYTYFVTALSAAGQSGSSNQVSATPLAPIDFSITASPTNFGIAAGGTASTRLTLTPVGTAAGYISLTVSGLPAGLTTTFNPASPLTIAAGTAASDTLTFTASGVAAGTYTLTLTATSGTFVHTVPLMLTVVGSSSDSVQLTDMFLTGSSPTLQLTYPNRSGVLSYTITRNGGAPVVVTSTIYNDSNGLQFNTSTQSPVSYVYSVQQQSYSYKDSNGNTVTVPGFSGTCTVVPMQSPATDNQAVDSRLDPRYSTNVLINHNFGSTSYRGGLFAGYNSDPARVGRSLIKFALPPIPSGQHLWRVGSVLAYATRGFTPGTSTTNTVFCQRVSDTWTGLTATWSLAPAILPAPSGGGNGSAVTYDGTNPINTWVHWPLALDVYSALLSNGGVLSVGLASTNENSSAWTYFAKKEYVPALAPLVLYAYGATN